MFSRKIFTTFLILVLDAMTEIESKTKFLFPARAMKMFIPQTQMGAQALTSLKAITVGAFLIFSEIQLIRFQAHSDL